MNGGGLRPNHGRPQRSTKHKVGEGGQLIQPRRRRASQRRLSQGSRVSRRFGGLLVAVMMSWFVVGVAMPAQALHWDSRTIVDDNWKCADGEFGDIDIEELAIQNPGVGEYEFTI